MSQRRCQVNTSFFLFALTLALEPDAYQTLVWSEKHGTPTNPVFSFSVDMTSHGEVLVEDYSQIIAFSPDGKEIWRTTLESLGFEPGEAHISSFTYLGAIDRVVVNVALGTEQTSHLLDAANGSPTGTWPEESVAGSYIRQVFEVGNTTVLHRLRDFKKSKIPGLEDQVTHELLRVSLPSGNSKAALFERPPFDHFNAPLGEKASFNLVFLEKLEKLDLLYLAEELVPRIKVYESSSDDSGFSYAGSMPLKINNWVPFPENLNLLDELKKSIGPQSKVLSHFFSASFSRITRLSKTRDFMVLAYEMPGDAFTKSPKENIPIALQKEDASINELVLQKMIGNGAFIGKPIRIVNAHFVGMHNGKAYVLENVFGNPENIALSTYSLE